VTKLLSNSIVNGGYLGLGSKENLMFNEVFDQFETIDSKEKIYKKKLL